MTSFLPLLRLLVGMDLDRLPAICHVEQLEESGSGRSEENFSFCTITRTDVLICGAALSRARAGGSSQPERGSKNGHGSGVDVARCL